MKVKRFEIFVKQANFERIVPIDIRQTNQKLGFTSPIGRPRSSCLTSRLQISEHRCLNIIKALRH
jgi:hypothetical protein